jgi:hypothetical protein
VVGAAAGDGGVRLSRMGYGAAHFTLGTSGMVVSCLLQRLDSEKHRARPVTTSSCLPRHRSRHSANATATAATAPGFAPGKATDAFRVYDDSGGGTWDAGVREHYRQMRVHQCVAFADRLEAEGLYSFHHRQMTVRQAFDALNAFTDRSDPDLEVGYIWGG